MSKREEHQCFTCIIDILSNFIINHREILSLEDWHVYLGKFHCFAYFVRTTVVFVFPGTEMRFLIECFLFLNSNVL